MRTACLLAAAMLVAAGTAAEAADAGRKSLVLEAVGRISPRCDIGALGGVDFGDLRRSGLAIETRFGLSCNVPFDINLRSANGGLAHETLPRGQGPYSGLAAYRLAINVPLESGNPGRGGRGGSATGDFTSRQLQAGQVISSRGGVAFDGGRLNIEMMEPEGAGLLAGRYWETVEISLVPRL